MKLRIPTLRGPFDIAWWIWFKGHASKSSVSNANFITSPYDIDAAG